MDIPIDIAGRPLLTMTATSSSNFLTIPKANSLYVNEAGDQMRGNLDMNNYRIQNLGDAIYNKDATTKEYVNSSILLIESEIRGELGELNENLRKHGDNLKTLETGYTSIADRLKDVTNKDYVDNRITSNVNRVKRELDDQMRNELQKLNEDSTKLRDRVNAIERNYTTMADRLVSLPYQHHSVLDIGSSLDEYYKITEHTVEITKPDEWDDIDVNFQITPIVDTTTYHDQIFMNIRNYNIERQPSTFKINMSVLSVRSTNEIWGLQIHAHLLITVFRKIFKIQKLIPL